MKTVNPILDIIFGMVFLSIGFVFVYKRVRIADALMSSSRVFWEKLGFTINYKRGIFVTNIMIPIMGAIFFVCGIVSLLKFVTYFLK